MNISKLNVEQEMFSGKKIDDIAVITFRAKPLLQTVNLTAKKALFDYVDLVAACDDVKVLLIKEASTKMNRDEYVAFYKNMMGSGSIKTELERLYNGVSQFIMSLVGLNKMVVRADSGDVIFLFMNIGLACDYRIVADNTIFQNPNIELGVVPKGGSTFLLSKMVGGATASKLLFSSRDIDAEEARHLGIVDEVVPLKELDIAALERARSFARIPSGYAVGVKKLLNYDIKELANFLEYENEMLRKLVGSCKLGRESSDY